MNPKNTAQISSENNESPEEILPNLEYNQPMRQSRLQNLQRKQSKKTIALTILGMFLITIAALTIGPRLLIQFSLLIGNVKETSEEKNNNTTSSEFIRPPILDPVTAATNSATLSISGNAEDGKIVKLYINEEFEKTVDIKNGSFTTKLELRDGKNTITAKAFTEKNQKSDLSNEITVVYKNKAPKLEISFPSDGQIFTGGDSNITVSGSSDPEAKVTINGFWAIMKSDGNFSYDLPLQNGDNTVKVTATDEAGNKTEKELRVKYQ